MSEANVFKFAKLYGDLDKKTHKHLILGNGFSIAANKKFDYKSLYQAATLTDKARSIFDRHQTTNFEDVIKTLEETIANNKTFGKESPEIEQEKELIKSLLVQTVAEVHPNYAEVLKVNDSEACRAFLSKFSSIFTFNYDLLLYWIIMRDQSKFSDGFKTRFGKCVFVDGFREKRTSLMYLHGAMHLFTYQKYIFKRIADDGKRVTDIIRDAMDDEKYPLAVTEGDPKSKKKKIEKNEYLKKCWEHLSDIGGAIFTYGLSFCEQDSHFIETIIRNKKIKKLYIGYYSDKAMIANNVRKIQTARSDLHIQYYRSEEAGIWGRVKEKVG